MKSEERRMRNATIKRTRKGVVELNLNVVAQVNVV